MKKKKKRHQIYPFFIQTVKMESKKMYDCIVLGEDNLTFPMVWNREVLKEAAVRIGIGKLVAPGTFENRTPGPVSETP